MCLTPSITLETPRTVVRTTRCWVALLLMPCVFLPLWFGITVMTLKSAAEARHMRDRGIRTGAEITSLYAHPGRRRDDDTIKHVVFRYRVEERNFTRDVVVRDGDYTGLAIGEPVPIIYDSLLPSDAQIDLHGQTTDGTFYRKALAKMAIAQIAILALPLLSVLIVEAWYRGERRLLARGALATATIINERRYRQRPGRSLKQVEFVDVTYLFTPPDGEKVTGTRRYVPVGSDIAQAVLNEPTVLYLLDNPRCNALWPLTYAGLRQ